MNAFTAFVIREDEQHVSGQLEKITRNSLSEGDVLIKTAYSSVNYKDSLASQKNGGVLRSFPMIPGIDVSGTIVEVGHSTFSVGQKVLITGYGLGVSHTGGFSEYVQVPADWVIPIPESMTLKEAMILGTAGFTAALSIIALEKNGLAQQKDASIIVTGASGGVGSLAILMLRKLGYTSITALTRKKEAFDTLKKLGATDCLLLDEFLPEKQKPLAKQTFHFAIDTTGGNITSTLLSQLYYGGTAALCGNAAGITLETTVLPFILRGVHLLGIDSVNVDYQTRLSVWQRLATDLAISEQAVMQEITLAELPNTFDTLQAGTHLGRTIVRLS